MQILTKKSNKKIIANFWFKASSNDMAYTTKICIVLINDPSIFVKDILNHIIRRCWRNVGTKKKGISVFGRGRHF